ncbi:MAG: hypothetical protein V8Q17_08885 [Acutalibacteraceae bacterium]
MAAIASATIARAVKKGNAPALSCNGFHHSIGRVLPKNKWVLLTVVTLALTCIVPAFFVGLVWNRLHANELYRRHYPKRYCTLQ